MKWIFTIMGIIAAFPVGAAEFFGYQVIAEEVRNKLVEAYGEDLASAPAILITDKNLPIANYKSRIKLITLERSVFDFCRSFQQDSLDALAFIIGHELSHHYREQRGTFGFARDCLSNTELSVRSEERQADIWGAFTAFLAGYKTIEILPKIIERLYLDFGLDKKIKNYPDFSEREQTDLVVFEEVQKMIELHKAGAWLIALGEYDLATANYEYIAQFYPSKEIHNNLGVSYALQAIYFTGNAIDKFIYPLTLDWSTPLSHIKKSRGDGNLNIGEMAVRRDLLGKAIVPLITIKKQNKNYLLSQLNLINAYALWGKGMDNYRYPKKGVKIYERLERRGLLNESELKEKFQMVYALACFRSNQRINIEKGKNVLKELLKSSNQLVVEQATFNLSVFNQKGTSFEYESTNCKCPKELENIYFLDNEDIVYRTLEEPLFLTADTRTTIKQDTHYINFAYEIEEHYTFLLERQFIPNIHQKIIPTFNSEKDTCKWLPVNNGGFLIAPAVKSGIYLNQSHQVVETIKFYQAEE